jgi:hypothetical protein
VKITVELEINDSLWADFSIFIEESHKDCCKQTTSEFIESKLREFIIWTQLQDFLNEVSKKHTIEECATMIAERAEELKVLYE